MNSLPTSFLACAMLFTTFSFAQSPDKTINRLAEKALALEKTFPQIITFSPFIADASFDGISHELIIEEVAYYSVDFEKVVEIIENNYPLIELEIPYNNNIITLQLFPSDIFAEGFGVFTSQSGNENIEYIPGANYRGIIKGDYQSFAAISFFENNISGTISSAEKGNIVIANLKSSATHVIYNDKDLLIPNNFSCATPDNENMEIKKKDYAEAEMLISPCVKVYIEADFEMYAEEAGATRTADQIVAFFNVSSTIFFNDGITTVISEIFVWTTIDPYPITSSFDALDYFTTYRTIFNGDLAHLVTYDLGGLGGVAWVDALCTSSNYAYSNIDNYYEDFPTYSWTIDVFTHEMGHNLGSPHTHSCSWVGGAIDDCYTPEGACDPGPTPFDGGTIMSYCHLTGYGKNFSFGFGPLPADLILDEVNTAACIGECELPPINDWPCSAITLDVNESCIFMEGTNVGAINSVVTSVVCDGISEGDVWFKLTIPTEGYVIIETDNGAIINDMGMKIYLGECNNLDSYPGGCVADGSSYSTLMPGFLVTGAPGTLLFVRIWEVGNDAFGDFSICAYTECTSSTAPAGITAGDISICEGENTVLYHDGGSLGSLAQWTWYKGACSGIPVAIGDSIEVLPDITTTYFLRAIGLCDTTNCVEITIETAPIPGIPVIINTDCFLSVEFVDDAIYTWYLNGVIIDDEINNTLIITENGDYSVMITTNENCSAASDAVSVECEPLAIENIYSQNITIYPNPAEDFFTIEIAEYTGDVSIILFDLTGRMIEEKNVFVTNMNNRIEFDLKVSSGIYLLQINLNGMLDNRLIMIK